MDQEKITITGGANIGMVNVSWPLATLIAETGRIHIKAFFLGEYTFSPNQVIAIEKYTIIPFFGSGIRIKHTVSGYPRNIIFWCLCNPEKLIARISKVGFSPQAPKNTIPVHQGIPVRWQSIILLLIVWNGLFYMGMRTSAEPTQINNIYTLIALSIVFSISMGVKKGSIVLQKIILKPNRNFTEIKPFINLL